MSKTVEQLAEYYAHNYFDMHETNNYKALKQGFLAGYNKAKQEQALQDLMNPEWNYVKEKLPEEDVEVVCKIVNKEIPEIGKHSILRYYQGNWYGDLKSDEKVEKWKEM